MEISHLLAKIGTHSCQLYDVFFMNTLIHKKKVEVIARKRIQNFMLALGNLIQ